MLTDHVDIAVGIDLGTTNSCVGIWQRGKVEIIANDQLNTTTPSYVAFTTSEHLIGDAARNQVSFNPQNTVFNVTRLIGRKFNDPDIQQEFKHWPFKVISDCGKSKILVEFKGVQQTFSPEEISSMVLAEMKRIAESFLGTSVKNAVITVPVEFNYFQRQAIRDAGTIAGLNVLRIINESTADALAYGSDTNLKDAQNIIIFDLGGGTLNVSVLIIDGGLFEVKAAAGNTRLGGVDFDNRLVQHFVREFKVKHRRDISKNYRALQRLRIASERIKRTLSTNAEASIDIISLESGINFHSKVSRACFEELCTDLFKSTLETVEQALRYAKMRKDDIDDVVVVGGSTRIPKVQNLLQNFFGGRLLNLSMNPEESAAYGAAIQAAILSGSRDPAIPGMLLLDVAPVTLGYEVTGGIMKTIIERNSQIPYRTRIIFPPSGDKEAPGIIKVFEGERAMVKYNKYLGQFNLNQASSLMGEESAPINVFFDLDAGGILNVFAKDNITRQMKNILINKNEMYLSEGEIGRMIREVERFRLEDEKRRVKEQARERMKSYILDVKETLTDVSNKLNLHCQECDYILRSLDDNTLVKKEEIDEKMTLLQRTSVSCIRPLLKKLQRLPNDMSKSGAGITLTLPAAATPVNIDESAHQPGLQTAANETSKAAAGVPSVPGTQDLLHTQI